MKTYMYVEGEKFNAIGSQITLTLNLGEFTQPFTTFVPHKRQSTATTRAAAL